VVNATRETYCIGQVDDTSFKVICVSGCHFTNASDKARFRDTFIQPDTDGMGQGLFRSHCNLGIRTQEPAIPCSYCTWNDNCPFSVGSRPESSGRLDQQCYWDATALGINAWPSTLFKIVSAIAMVHLEREGCRCRHCVKIHTTIKVGRHEEGLHWQWVPQFHHVMVCGEGL
jgi:hypothetical protein